MRHDPTPPIVAAARRRHELTRAKAIKALRELERTGATVSFAAVAKAARISRSWMYTEPDLAGEITRLREATADRPKGRAMPAAQRASDASLRRRLELAEQRIRELRPRQRAAAPSTRSRAGRPTPRRLADTFHYRNRHAAVAEAEAGSLPGASSRLHGHRGERSPGRRLRKRTHRRSPTPHLQESREHHTRAPPHPSRAR